LSVPPESELQRARRRIGIAVRISLAAHALLLLLPAKKLPDVTSAAPGPMQVTIVDAPPAATPEPQPTPEAQPAPVPRPVPPRKPRELSVPKVDEVPRPEPLPKPSPTPQVDMMASINARRQQRRAEESAAARTEPGAPPTAEQSTSDAINRNLASLGGGQEGVGGVFQILRMGPRTAEFAFNGFRGESQKRWREVIEVDAGQGGDVQRAVVQRMIGLIREHYTEEFNWNSHRLGRIVVLSARVQDQAELEDYLIREFFGTPTLRR
jgi:hypothetical protein